ncbi:MAG: AAA family ATPase [Methanoregula sp.]|jgi:SpoVK/Ycf46/Vps4 family AAA+-type ATPase
MYATSAEHLMAELGRIEEVVFAELGTWRAAHEKIDRDYLGLCITEEEIDALTGTTGESTGSERPDGKNETLLAARLEIIEKEKSESLSRGTELRLHTLSQLFCLSREETDILLVALLPEIDLRFEKIYAYLQNDVTRKLPTVDLVSRLLFPGRQIAARSLFEPSSPLLKHRLLMVSGTAGDNQTVFPARPLKVDDRVVRYLLGSDGIDERLNASVTVVQPSRRFSSLIDSTGTIGRFRAAARSSCANGLPLVAFLSGPEGTGKRHAAEAIAGELQNVLLVADAHAFRNDKNHDLLAVLVREAVLLDGIILFERSDTFAEPEFSAEIPRFFALLDSVPVTAIFSSEKPFLLVYFLEHHAVFTGEFPLPTYDDRLRIWKDLLAGYPLPEEDIRAVAATFRFSAGQIRDAISAAETAAQARDEGYRIVTAGDLVAACKARSNRNLVRYAKQIPARYTWDDIFVKPETLVQLREIGNYIRYHATVYSDWGFEQKHSLGKGINILFSGISGTGKTMAAEIIARDAAMDLYKTDLSSVVSKYIGETEKNLRSIFSEAETSNAILFFDEADALFGKRTQIHDAHDRYANVEVNYLLQKMEEYEGIVILASNLSTNIDEAFRRRMHFSVEFAMPEKDIRMAIWKHAFPKKTPVSPELDFRFLSGFKITGGNIRNIAISSAFLAAADSGTVTMRHLVMATKREFQKIGRLYTHDEFGPYRTLLEEESP